MRPTNETITLLLFVVNSFSLTDRIDFLQGTDSVQPGRLFRFHPRQSCFYMGAKRRKANLPINPRKWLHLPEVCRRFLPSGPATLDPAQLLFASGNSIVTSRPGPGVRLRNRNAPRYRPTSRCTIAMPRPVPFACVRAELTR